MLAPGEALFYVNRGLAYRAIGDYQSAIADYDSAIEIDAKPEIYKHRAEAYTRLKRYDRPIDDYEAALKLDPFDAGAIDRMSSVRKLMASQTKVPARRKKTARTIERR